MPTNHTKHTIFYNFLSSFFNVLLVIATKIMIENHIITPETASFFRSISALIIISPFLISTLKKNPNQFLHKVPHKIMFIRAFFFSICAFIWPIVYSNIPLHIATTICFIVPFLSNIFLTIFLKEKTPSYIWVSMLIGTIGVVIILKPHIHEFNIYYILALVCVAFWAIAATLNKFIAQSKVQTNIAIYYLTFYSTIITSFIIFGFKIPISKNILIPLSILGIIATLAQYFMIKSYQTSTGYLVNSMEFIRFLMFLAADILLFQAHITTATVVGSGIIGLSMYYIIIKYKQQHQITKQ